MVIFSNALSYNIGTVPYKATDLPQASYHMSITKVPKHVEAVIEDEEERVLLCFGSKTLMR